MSTFDGFVSEFPLIRIDHFRTLPGKIPPVACFLSHVHSDHLLGLESLKSPFVYCSSATRELLLRLEKYPHRMNLARGILECRIQTYKHLRKLLKPLPLETPVRIELCPGTEIQVTLFDANHCLGAVMFLIEGQGKTILYTGDIRSESWWINSLTRNPIMLPYASGNRQLDKLYLDTTFAVKDAHHARFPSKADGIAELLAKVSKYPHDTVFYVNAWTFGYEDVWLALSNALRSPIHLDRYRYDIYTAVASPAAQAGLAPCREAPALAGFTLGNTTHPGILTRDPAARIHSCERGSGCPALSTSSPIVTITPIVSRHAGLEIRELGAGGGKGDLDHAHELELPDPAAVQHLLALCARSSEDPRVLRRLEDMVRRLADTGETSLALDDVAPLLDDAREDAIPLDQLPRVLAALAAVDGDQNAGDRAPDAEPDARLSSNITFPYARHSSYGELRALVAALKPRDIWPCTVPPVRDWSEALSMGALFGDLCGDGKVAFAHDVVMRRRVSEAAELQSGELKRKRRAVDSQSTVDENETESEAGDEARMRDEGGVKSSAAAVLREVVEVASSAMHTTKRTDTGIGKSRAGSALKEKASPHTGSPKSRLQARKEAFAAAQAGTWHTIELESTRSSWGDEEL